MSFSGRGIAFCADVAHAHSLARVLNEHGITALAVDGEMKKEVGTVEMNGPGR